MNERLANNKEKLDTESARYIMLEEGVGNSSNGDLEKTKDVEVNNP